ncbi:amidase [Pseudoclavibacter endophyticus]|uniref:Amidase n=1 Tax=Pseudoclavibacter endophyticus TaxID=1778590 RepID=A0A6H9WPS0_9MICO|nr:amidase family protein [Pseudoclavibacter endophyticus]KAB1648977.1 amidase [Pseudoclavibacter endophyticus]GGA66596.1 amidase [Pseudoclavibacter endophyticus]
MRPDREYGHVRPPHAEELQEYARRRGVDLGREEAAELVPVLAGMMREFDTLDELPEPAAPPVSFPRRDPGRAPTAEEDPYNAFIRLCRVEGAEDGPLAGLTAAVKDSIAVAGVPMTNASRMQPTLVPTEDAVAVERILAAGATIVGKTNLEDMAMGGGEGSVYGPALNPKNPAYSTGGSSTGSAAAVASGAVDFALGADEAGSIRIPSSWSGIVGMKATHGLVPSYGLTYFDHTLDHIGPMTRDVATNARVLQALVGPDWRDPQWRRSVPVVDDYEAGIGRGVEGLRFAVVDEAVEWSSDDVRECFERACDALRDAGATIEHVSVPLWQSAWPIENGLLTFSMRAMIDSAGAGYFHRGRIDPQALSTYSAQYRTSPRLVPVLTQLNLLAAEHLRDHYHGAHYAKAQNLRIELTRQLDEATADGRVLLTPTTTTVATELSTERHSFVEVISRIGGTSVLNTCPTDLSGHPSLSVPSGTGANDLPVGLQLIGGDSSEATLYAAGAVIEAAGTDSTIDETRA